MGQTPSRTCPITIPSRLTNQSSPIFSIPEELIARICDKDFKGALTKTCATIYNIYAYHCRNRRADILYNPPNYSFFHDYCMELLLQDYMNQSNWLYFKPRPISSYRDSSYPAKILCFNANTLTLPEKFNCTCTDTLIIFSASEPTPSYFEKIELAITNSFGKKVETMPIASFVEKFTNLTSISLRYLTLDDEIVSVISKLGLLRHISLYHCKMDYSHLLRMFKDCPSLEEIQLIYPKFDRPQVIKFSSGVKIVKISCHLGSFEVDMSDCTRLEDLAIKSVFHIPVNVISFKSECLRVLEPDCYFEDDRCFGNSLVTVETLVLNWHRIFNKEALGLFVERLGYRKRNLNLSTLKNLKELRIKGYSAGDKELRCTLPSGFGTIHVKLIPPSKSEPIKSQEFQLDPTRPINVLLHLN